MDYECKVLLEEIRDLLKANNKKLDDVQNELSSINNNIPSSVDYNESKVISYINSLEEKTVDIYEFLSENTTKD